VNLAFRLAFARPPSSEERSEILNYLQTCEKTSDRNAAWSAVCHTLLASAEFRYLH